MENHEDLFSLFGTSKLAAKVKNIDGQIRVRRNITSSNEDVPSGQLEGHVSGASDIHKELPQLSFASAVKNSQEKKMVKIQEMHSHEVVEGARVAIPMSAVEEVSSRFSNTLYGYFVGKRLPFPLVENYVKNTWAKYGLKRVMLEGHFFLFQFETKGDMEKVIEAGPWLIRRQPLLLNIWSPDAVLTKDNIRSVPVWVKLHHVPIVAYSEVALSLITTQIGRPIMLDAYSSSMCLKSWGRKEYARALIEVTADEELLESMVIAIPSAGEKGHSLVTIKIEYEWKPPRCATCKVFDHKSSECPKNITLESKVKADHDGFIEVNRKSNKGKNTKQIEAVRLTKSKPNFQYRKVVPGNNSQAKKVKVDSGNSHQMTSSSNSFSALAHIDEDNEVHGVNMEHEKDNILNASDSEAEDLVLENKDGTRLRNQGVDNSNKFSVLANTGVELCDLDSVKDLLNVLNESDSDEDELTMEDEDGVNIGASDLKGASTPSIEVDHD